ncbi:AMP-binding protein [Streptomyces sp. SID685]|nr:AMP-binding protein [Streptomyces sp. SID685]
MTDPHDKPVSAPALPRSGPTGVAESSTAGAHPMLGALFATWVARTPDAPALTDGRRTWTYRQLAERADRLAAHLIRRGAGPDRVVALVLPRSMELIAAELAVSRAGAAFLPAAGHSAWERRCRSYSSQSAGGYVACGAARATSTAMEISASKKPRSRINSMACTVASPSGRAMRSAPDGKPTGYIRAVTSSCSARSSMPRAEYPAASATRVSAWDMAPDMSVTP